MEVTMTGASTGSVINAGQNVPAKRTFFQWAVKWFYASMSENTDEKPDAPTLACLLQSIGFQLREFEKSDDISNTDKRELKKDTIIVTIDCGTSGMRARLEMNDVNCQCPNSDDADDASFWSVSGTGPAVTVESTNKIEESGSNLLPSISKDTKKVLSEVIYRLIAMIGDKTIDVNQNDRSRSNLNLTRVGSTMDIMEMVNESLKNDTLNIVRSHTQPEIAVNGISGARRYNLAARSLAKECNSGISGLASKTWCEMDCTSMDGDNPRPSPPKIASSPVILNQLCSSLGQISLQSEEEASNLAEHVIKAHRCLEKAVEIITGRRSPLSFDSSIHDKATFLKPRNGGSSKIGSQLRKTKTNSRLSPSNASLHSRPGSSCSTSSGQMLSTSSTMNTSATSERQTIGLPSKSPLTRRSAGATLTKLSSTPLSSLNSSAKRNIPQLSGTCGASKIPGRRKSFGALASAQQPLKLAVAKARTNASAMKKNLSTTLIGSTADDRVIITAKRRVSPDPKSHDNNSANAVQRSGSNLGTVGTNSNASGCLVLPVIKTAGTKTSVNTKESAGNVQTNATSVARRSLGNPKFGFNNKKA